MVRVISEKGKIEFLSICPYCSQLVRMDRGETKNGRSCFIIKSHFKNNSLKKCKGSGMVELGNRFN